MRLAAERPGDGKPLALDPAHTGPSAGLRIAALGLVDTGPVFADIANPGLTRRPLNPVHPRAERLPDGSLQLGWKRRARGAWAWPDEVEIPLGEQAEAYRVGLGPLSAPLAAWDVTQPQLTLDGATGVRGWKRLSAMVCGFGAKWCGLTITTSRGAWVLMPLIRPRPRRRRTQRGPSGRRARRRGQAWRPHSSPGERRTRTAAH